MVCARMQVFAAAFKALASGFEHGSTSVLD